MPNIELKPTCETCRYWARCGENEVGRCRVNPPERGANCVAEWPISNEKDVCGWFEPQPEAAAVQ